MNILYVNSAFREGSRTRQIAEAYLKKCNGNITEVDLGTANIMPLDQNSLKKYNEAVANHKFDDAMFDYAKQFIEADEIVISAPFWNYSIPAVLHTYFELVCTQGISFDISNEGEYFSKCKAKKLTYITTAGGYIPEQDSAFGYIKSLTEVFWNIKEVNYIKAEGLDIFGVDVTEKINKVIDEL